MLDELEGVVVVDVDCVGVGVRLLDVEVLLDEGVVVEVDVEDDGEVVEVDDDCVGVGV